jgi:hypothetical protein
MKIDNIPLINFATMAAPIRIKFLAYRLKIIANMPPVPELLKFG